MRKCREYSEDELKLRFSISPLVDAEIDAGGEGWVGLTPFASHTLRQNVTAAVIAEKMGYASVDYVRKTYLSDMEEYAARDESLRILARRHHYLYDEFYRAFAPRTDAPLGVFAFDLAMVRARGSLELLVAVARQGFLIEPALIARGLVEQFAYAAYVWNKTENAEVFEVQPQNLIRHLTQVCPTAGRAYGLLSKVAHYNPKGHYHFIGDSEGSTVNQRSWRFKILSSAWVFFIFELKFIVFQKFYGDYPNFHILEDLQGSSLEAFDRHFAGVPDFWTKEIRSLFPDTSA